MLTEYLLSSLQAQGKLPKDPLVVKTIVSSPLIPKVAAHYGAQTVDLLTGFKYIGELVTKLEQKGETERFILGFEESYGYLRGAHARDKDAVVASMLICEMAAYYKQKGMSLYDFMQSIYQKYGMYLSTLLNFGFEGAAGMQKMHDMMSSLRANAPKKIAGARVTAISDYQESVAKDMYTGTQTEIHLPKSNVLRYDLESGDCVIVRPSGTEPKIKVYITSVSKTKAEASARAEEIAADMEKRLGV